MSQPLDIEALEAEVVTDPGAPVFATLAEAYRRLGRLDDARRVAVAGLAERPDDTQGRLALGLTLLDLGETAAARYELERAMTPIEGLEAIGGGRDADATYAGAVFGSRIDAVDDEEVEAAFALAEPIEDEMIDANQIAQEAMRASQLDEPEGFRVEETPAFATATMARLLDEQGDRAAAEAIRHRLDSSGEFTAGELDAAVVPAAVAEALGTNGFGASSRVLATLESWLDNLGGGRR